MTSSPKFLIVGATGYIGGTLLTHFVDSTAPALENASFTVLLRGSNERVEKLKERYGERVNVAVYEGLGDLDTAVEVASQHDIVVNAGLGYHPPSAAALVRGLAKRKEATGREVFMIHTSGTSNLSDQPASGIWVDKEVPHGREFDDVADDLYIYQKKRDTQHPYPQRTSELGVIDAGLQHGVNTLIIQVPTAYGVGTGVFNKLSIQVPSYVRSMLAHRRAVQVDDGAAVWDHVHVKDLAELYELAVLDMANNGGRKLPRGKKGIIFCGNGRHTWGEVAQATADAVHKAGKLDSNKVESMSLKESAPILTPAFAGGPNENLVELALASNAKTTATVAKDLGWNPTRGEDVWKQAAYEDLQEILVTESY